MTHLPRRQRESSRFHTKLRHTTMGENDISKPSCFEFHKELIRTYLSVVEIRFGGKSRAEAAAAADYHASIESGNASGKKQDLDQIVSHLSRMVGSVWQVTTRSDSSCFIRSSIFILFRFIFLILHKHKGYNGWDYLVGFYVLWERTLWNWARHVIV